MLTAAAGFSSYKISSDTKHKQAYLQRNQLDVIEAIALGEGRVMDDLVMAFRVPEAKLPAFKELITARYEELALLVAGERVSEEDAMRFFTVIESISVAL